MDEGGFIVGKASLAGHTTVHPLGLLAIAILGISVLLLPRRWSVLPFLVMACFVSSAQRVVIAGIDFDFMRIMVLFGVMRLILHKEYLHFTWKPLDTAVVLWTISSVVFFVLREGSFGAVVNRLGFAFNSFGMYFLLRCFIRDWSDLDRIAVGMIWISIPVVIFFLLENRTGRNLFSVFGGVPAITAIREGRLRCQGAFAHPILAGCFWASLMPLFAVLWWKKGKNRIVSVTGLTTSLVIIFCCSSSTPLMGVAAIWVGAAMFFLRSYMKYIFWSGVACLTALHFAMEAPVWHLISRISAVGGSTGYHRFLLIDRAVNYFNDWALWGCGGEVVAYKWRIHAGDVTNQYLLEGINGGFVTFVLFVVILICAYRGIGRLWRSQRTSRYRLMHAWALGICLFVHSVNFIGVSYFGQIWIIWFLLLAAIGSLTPIRSQRSIQCRRPQRYRKAVSTSG